MVIYSYYSWVKFQGSSSSLVPLCDRQLGQTSCFRVWDVKWFLWMHTAPGNLNTDSSQNSPDLWSLPLFHPQTEFRMAFRDGAKLSESYNFSCPLYPDIFCIPSLPGLPGMCPSLLCRNGVPMLSQRATLNHITLSILLWLSSP